MTRLAKMAVCLFVLCGVVSSAWSQDDLQQWTDREWDQLEVSRTAAIVQSLVDSDLYAEHLVISTPQKDQLQPIVQRWRQDEEELGLEIRDLRKQIALMKYENKPREAEKLEQRISNEAEQLDKKYLQQVFEQVLMPAQVTRVKQIAKQFRLVEQSIYGDEFDIVLYLVDETEMSDAEKRQAERVIEEIRQEYLQNVAELREQAEIEVLKSLKPEKRQKFRDRFGEFYDYPAERAQARQRRNASRKRDVNEKE